ncbi:MAG: efflux RND transporter periplasmic adaptor subunit [Candidatus Puniceispirillales bacterium]
MNLIRKITSYSSKAIVALGILFLGVSGYNYLVATKPEKPLQPRLEKIWTVEVASIDFQVAFPKKSSFGQVEASRKSSLNFNITGDVEQVSDIFKNGGYVTKGQELARLDRELLTIARDEIVIQLEANKTNITELAIQLDLRQKNYERTRQMNVASVASQANLDEARLALSMAKNALEQAKRQQAQLELNLKRASKQLSDTILTAPFDGIVSSVNIGRGMVVSPAIAVGTITDLSSLEVSFVVPGDVYANASKLIGDPVNVIWRSGGQAITSLDATITRAEGNVQSGEGGGRFYAEITLSDKGDWIIPEGAFVEVIYTSGQVDNVAAIPEAALYDDNSVFVIINGRTVKRQVEVVQKAEGIVFVRGNINNGEQVVATRLPALGDGILVKPGSE